MATMINMKENKKEIIDNLNNNNNENSYLLRMKQTNHAF